MFWRRHMSTRPQYNSCFTFWVNRTIILLAQTKRYSCILNYISLKKKSVFKLINISLLFKVRNGFRIFKIIYTLGYNKLHERQRMLTLVFFSDILHKIWNFKSDVKTISLTTVLDLYILYRVQKDERKRWPQKHLNTEHKEPFYQRVISVCPKLLQMHNTCVIPKNWRHDLFSVQFSFQCGFWSMLLWTTYFLSPVMIRFINKSIS